MNINSISINKYSQSGVKNNAVTQPVFNARLPKLQITRASKTIGGAGVLLAGLTKLISNNEQPPKIEIDSFSEPLPKLEAEIDYTPAELKPKNLGIDKSLSLDEIFAKKDIDKNLKNYLNLQINTSADADKPAKLYAINKIQKNFENNVITETEQLSLFDEVHNITKENIEIFDSMLDVGLENIDGSTRFHIDLMKNHLKPQSSEKVAVFDKMANLKNKEGAYFFAEPFLYKFLEDDNNGKLQVFNEVLEGLKNYDLEYNRLAFDTLIHRTNDENIFVLPMLMNAKAPSGKSRFQLEEINQILDAPDTSMFKALPLLLDAKAEEGTARFSSSSVVEIFRNLNSGNIDALPIVVNAKSRITDTPRFDAYNIGKILASTTEDNSSVMPFMVNKFVEKDQQNLLSSWDMINLLPEIKADNKKIFSVLMNNYMENAEGSKAVVNSVDVGINVLSKLKDSEADALQECLYLKSPLNKKSLYFNGWQNQISITYLAKAFSKPDLKPIAQKIIKEKTFSNFPRFTSVKEIDELCKVIHSKKNKLILNKVMHMRTLDKLHYRFTSTADIVNLTKGLSDFQMRPAFLYLLKMKNHGSEFGYRFNDFSSSAIFNNKITEDDYDKVKLFANVSTENGKSLFNVESIFNLAKKYKDISFEKLPVPEELPEKTDFTFCLNKVLEYQSNELNINSLSIAEKLQLKTYAAALAELPISTTSKYDFDVKSLVRDIDKSISQTIVPTETSNEAKIDLFRNVLSNKPQVENVIKNTNFAKYERKGLPLKYTRKNFVADLNNVLNSQDEKTKSKILQKLQIELTNGNGYNGVINILELNKTNKIENQIYDLCKNFILENEVKTGDEAYDNFANSLMKGMPEFVNIIGKQSHGSHNYSVDIHILQVLKNAISNPEYEKLSSLDKTKLKMAILMHDMAKRDAEVDKNHQNTSALYARNILQKYNMPQSVKDNIYLIIKNHHWLEALNTNSTTIDELSCNFKYKNDFAMSKIFADADLKAVSPSIYNAFRDVIDSDKAKTLESKINKNKETGNLLLTSKIVYPERIPQVKYGSKMYRVINFNDYKNDEDLSRIGFVEGTTKSDLRFLVHTARNAEALESVEVLSDVANNSVLSESFISLANSQTYFSDSMGVILESENTDIANAFSENQASGYAKNQSTYVRLRANEYTKRYRDIIPAKIQSELHISNNEYAKLYDIISPIKYLNQIQDDALIDIGEKQFKGIDVKKAIKKAQDELIDSKLKAIHNEAVIANSKVKALFAKKNSLKDIPQEYLDFAQRYNLPIYLLGEK